MLTRWRQQVRELKHEMHALYLACRDPRTPWFAKVMGGVVLAYALSPIDLIPDFIPVLGYLDDLLLLPVGLLLVRRLIPPAVLAEHRAAVAAQPEATRLRSVAGAVAVVAVWVALAAIIVMRAF